MRSTPSRSRLAQAGLSIVEILIAMALGLLILGGVLYTFINSRPVFNANDAVARIQEDGRIAMERLAREIRQAGYTGCANSLDIEPHSIVDLNKDDVVDVAVPIDSIRVYDNGTGWINPTAITRVAGTDVIQVQGIGSCQKNLTEKMTANADAIKVGTNPCGWQANQVLVIADCSNVDIFAATNVGTTAPVTIEHASSKNKEASFSKIYGTEAVVFGFGEKQFFVGIHPDLNQPMLYEITHNGATTVVSDIAGNVYDMQVLSVKTDTDANGTPDSEITTTGSTLGAVADWNQVMGIRVRFSVRSEADNSGAENKTYTYNGVSITDRRLKRDFVTNIGIRNRLP
jgi:type IV pilus assembly protein PilW